MNANDQYLMSQVGPMLAPGEQVLFMSTMRRAPSAWYYLLGAVVYALMMKVFFVVLTNRRLILVQTKAGMWGGVKAMNIGVEEWDVRSIQQVKVGGWLQNRSMSFVMADGSTRVLRISPGFKAITGTKDFFLQVPQLLNSGQLGNQVAALGGQPAPAQLAPAPQQVAPQLSPAQQYYGAPPTQQSQQYAPPPPQQQAYAPPTQQPPQYAPPQPHPMQQLPTQQYGAPPMQGGPLAPGTQVVVTAPDGSRHLATVMQEQQGHYLCSGPAGQGWVPAQFVARA